QDSSRTAETKNCLTGKPLASPKSPHFLRERQVVFPQNQPNAVVGQVTANVGTPKSVETRQKTKILGQCLREAVLR
ncbi:hypothetical protein, partial [Aliiruegeria sabulilitoris]|uniref:hypothetical protein n=1 Tax=Aliiruegeria sabulilitoris TaxID=1510458 RepID=UPI001E2C5FC9